MITISIDDYHPRNLEIAARAKEYGVPVLWFIQCGQEHEQSQIVKLIHMGFEVGSHTLTHPMDMKLLSDEQVVNEVVRSKEWIEQYQPVRWFCYPRGRFDERTKVAIKAAGYQFARTTRVLRKDVDPLEIQNTLHMFPRKEYGDRIWQGLFEEQIVGNYDLHLWGHAKEIFEYGYFEDLISIFKQMAI